MLATLLITALLGGQGDNTLAAKLSALAHGHKGRVAIAVRHLETGEGFYLNADTPMPTASLVKFPVMIEVYFQLAEGEVKLKDKITLKEADKVPGSGILTDHFSEGATFSLRDAVRLMIAFSDNTATNLVLDRIGINSVAERMETLGCPNTKIHAKVFRGSTTSVFPERTKVFGLGSSTAREMVSLLQSLHEGKLVSADASKEMLEHLKKCDDKEKLPRFLPTNVVVAHKTGSISDARTDAGIIYTPAGPVAVCVLTDNNEDKSWREDNAGNALCAAIGKEVYEYYKSPKK